MNQLFDPEAYKSPMDLSKAPRKPPAKAAPEPPVPWSPPWTLISQRRGPLPYWHLPVEAARMAELRRKGAVTGSIYTECGEYGWPLDQQGVSTMIMCPDCLLSRS